MASMWLLRTRRVVIARGTAVLATVTVLWGWGAGQYPWLLDRQMAVSDAAASDPVLWALIAAFAAAAVLAVPALIWLYTLTEKGLLGEQGVAERTSTEVLLQRYQTGG